MVQSDFGQRTNEEGYRLARDAAQKAIAIDPNSAMAYAELGINYAAFGEDRAKAADAFAHALALEPANTDIITVAMKLARGLGRYEQVIALGEYVVIHDPLNTLAHATLGGAYIRAGRYDEGMASMETALRLAPGRSLGYYSIAMTLVQKGDPKAALVTIQKEPAGSWRTDGLAIVYHALGRKTESDAALAELIAKYERESAWNIAYVYAFRGEADAAFEWLEKAIVYHDPGLSLTAVQPQFANIRSDPRWLPFLRRIGLAPEQLAAIKFDVKVPAK
jgi:tetratricopeptide (TPR) repeat protein